MATFDEEKFRNECLAAHNKYRAKHGAPPLALSVDVNKTATEWAKHLMQSGKFEHRQNNPYGQNLYKASGKSVNGAEPVDKWYDEIKQYDFRKATFSLKTGHFTQVVWKSTRELGIGVAKTGDAIVVVCDYNPPGNFKGQFSENVLPAQ